MVMVDGGRSILSSAITISHQPSAMAGCWLMRDLRLAVRALRATPVVSFVAILSLALGIGANTAIFSIVNSLLLRALPVKAPQQLVQLDEASANGQRSWTYPIWDQIHRR